MRVFIFGIDGLTIRIMKPLMDKGVIPNFKSLYENGSKGILKGTIPPLTPPGWASIYTGKNPGKHGLFEFARRESYTFIFNTCWDYTEAPPFWKYLSDSGKRSVLLNIPLYYPPLKIQNCCSVSGFNALETFNIYHPESLKQELLREVPDYRVDSFWHHELPKNKKEAYIKDNVELTRARIKALKYLMNEKKWDLFFVVFTGTDRMQHFFWDDIVNGVPEVVQYYQLLDEALGYVLNSMNRDDFVFIVSDHGFRPIQKNVNLNSVLKKNGLLYLKETVEIPVNYAKLRRQVEKWGLIERLKKVIPKKFIDKLHEHSKIEGAFSFKKIDWTRTKAFASSGTYGGVCVNLKDREPDGIVDESEYESIRDRIVQIFSSLTDNNSNDDNAKKAIRNVYKREEIYSGKHLNEMPDVVLLAETDYRFHGTIEQGDIFREPRERKELHIITGEHEIDTIFMCRHHDFKKEFNDVSVTDVAPSVLNLFGLPIPTSMDGKSLFESFRKPKYLDELTGVIYEKRETESSEIKRKIKKMFG